MQYQARHNSYFGIVLKLIISSKEIVKGAHYVILYQDKVSYTTMLNASKHYYPRISENGGHYGIQPVLGTATY